MRARTQRRAGLSHFTAELRPGEHPALAPVAHEFVWGTFLVCAQPNRTSLARGPYKVRAQRFS